jgi:hypothetical protein
VRLNVKDTSKIDGWGTATFPAPGSSFNVLRNTHNMALETTLELYIILFANIGTWIPMPSSLIPAGLGDFLGGNIKDVMLWTNNRKQPLVTMSLDTNGLINTAEFQSDILLEPTSTLVSVKPSFGFYPNPASEIVQLQLPSNTLRILIRDVTGKLVKEEEISDADSSLRTSDLSNGVYNLEVLLSSGNPLRKKLVVRH